MKFKWMLIAVGGLISTAVNAMTLLDAVDAARGFDADILGAREIQQAGHEKRWQGAAGFLPRAQLDGGYQKQSQPGMPYGESVRRHDWSASVTQPVFDVSKLADYRRGNALSDSADVDYLKAQQKLVTEVSDAYFDVLYQREVLQAAGAAKQAFELQLRQANAALQVGDGTRTEVDEAQANLDEAHAREVSAQNDLEVARTVYRRLTGLSGDEVAAVQWKCVPDSVPMNLADSIDQAALGNLDVRAATLQVSRSEADVLTANSAHLPVVNLQASYGHNWSVGSSENVIDRLFGTTSNSRSSTVGVTVTIPLFAGGAQLSQSREAYHLRDAARNALESARRQAMQDASAAFLGVTNGVALIHAQERALASANNKMSSTRYGRELGVRTSIDELNAQQRYFESIRDLADARYKYLKTRLQLSAALGTLGDADLAALNCSTGS